MKENVENSKSIIRYFFYVIILLVMDVKALTIREPWATLIINGYKKYEFRSWKTNYRGRILIHAGLGKDKEYINRFDSYNIHINNGYIIGEAIITDCILVDDSFIKSLKEIDPIVYGKSNYIEKYAWKLENIKKYDNPIPIKGKLGLWNYEE